MRIKLFIILFELLSIISGVILMHLNPWFIFLSLGGLLFPTLRVLGLWKDLDEREFLSDEKSGNFSLIIIVILATLSIALDLEFKGDSILLFILAPLVFKSVIFASLAFPREMVISYIGRIMGILLLSFSLLSHGFSLVGLMESIPGISTLILAELSKKFRFLGASFFAMVILLFYFAFRMGIKPVMLITFVILSAPLIGLDLVSLRKEV